MTATLTSPDERTAPGTVATTLSAVHDQWMERTAQLLAPAAVPRATFWERWGAVRFLTDQFHSRFRLEWQLVESLGPLLPASIRYRLAGARGALERTGSELVAAGRRRGSGAQVAILVRRFLDQVRRWCAALELATATLNVEDLPDDSRQLLARLRTAAGLDL